MSVLKSLSFTVVQQAAANPVFIRRAKLINRLEEQRSLAANPNYVKIVKRWTNTDGEKKQVEKQLTVRPWWKLDASGNMTLSVSYGTKPIEFDKGKTGIVVPSKDKLISVIDTLIKATQQGELDGFLQQANGLRTQKANK